MKVTKVCEPIILSKKMVGIIEFRSKYCSQVCDPTGYTGKTICKREGVKSKVSVLREPRKYKNRGCPIRSGSGGVTVYRKCAVCQQWFNMKESGFSYYCSMACRVKRLRNGLKT